MKPHLLNALLFAAVASLSLVACEEMQKEEGDGSVRVSRVELSIPDQTVIALTDSLLLTYTVYPENAANKAVVWINSSPDVVSIDTTGLLKPIKPGESIVGVKTEDGGKRGIATVIVDEGFVHVSSVSMNISGTVDMVLGDSLQLKVTILPHRADNHNFSWQNSADDVVSIDSAGMMKAIGVGQSTIGVITEDREKTCKAVINVMPPVATAIRITDAEGHDLDSHDFADISESAIRLYTDILPADGFPRQLEWSSSNPYCCLVDSGGLVSITGGGTTTIYVRTKDGSNLCDSCTFTVPGTAIKDRNYDIVGGINEDGYYRITYEPVEITVPIFDENKQKTGTEVQVWLDRNLGARRRAESAWDEQAAGSLFQWGRCADGHEKITWKIQSNHLAFEKCSETLTINDASQRPTDRSNPGTDKFILWAEDWCSDTSNPGWGGKQYSASDNNYATQYSNFFVHAPLDSDTQCNNPCPYGYRVPTVMELNQMAMAIAGANAINISGTVLSSEIRQQFTGAPLYLMPVGYRNGTSGTVGSYGTMNKPETGYIMFWSCHASAEKNGYRWQLYMVDGTAKIAGVAKTSGKPIRCIKD